MAERYGEGQWVTIKGRHVLIGADGVPQFNEDVKKKQLAKAKEERDRLNGRKNSKETATLDTQKEHKAAIQELNKDDYEDGTYDISTKKTTEFNDGYQVTFCQIGDDYSDEEYAKKVNECLKQSSDGKTYAGKFEGTPEISFHWKDRKAAEAYGRANNQKSIWDWKQYQKAVAYDEAHPNPTQEEKDMSTYLWTMCEISTGGTGERRKK